MDVMLEIIFAVFAVYGIGSILSRCMEHWFGEEKKPKAIIFSRRKTAEEISDLIYEIELGGEEACVLLSEHQYREEALLPTLRRIRRAHPKTRIFLYTKEIEGSEAE